MREKQVKVEVLNIGDCMDLANAIYRLVWEAMRSGIDEEGESITILVPSNPVGASKDSLKECGQWTINITKTGD